MKKLDFLSPPVIKNVHNTTVPIFTADQIFFDHHNKELTKYTSCETKLYEFMSRLDQKIMAGGMDLGEEITSSIKTMASLFDACTAIPYFSREESEIIGDGYPAFVVYHKERGAHNFLLRRNRFALESLGFFSKKSFNPLVPSQWTPAIAGVSRFAPRHRSTPAIQNTFLQKGLHSQPFFVKYFGSAGVHYHLLMLPILKKVI